MCPMCIGAAAWYVAGMSSAGGIAAVFLNRSSGNKRDTHERHSGGIEKRDPDEDSTKASPKERPCGNP